MCKTVFNLLVASLLLIFFVGCSGSGDSGSGTNTTSTTLDNNSTISNLDPTTSNFAPIADAGADQTVTVGSLATLDGTGSYDEDQNYPLTYAWVITDKPDGSNAVSPAPDLSDTTFSFTPDKAGEYTIELVVTDSLGMESLPYEVLVSASIPNPDPGDQNTDPTNLAPVADAGLDQSLSWADTAVYLDGSKSYDPDGDSITYAWSITQKPASSTAYLIDPTAAQPTLVADLLGTYVIELIVTDNQGLDSLPDEVVITPEKVNIKPVAFAGGNDVATVGEPYALHGSGYDANGDDLTYSWAIVSTSPKDSLFELSGSDMPNPILTPYTEGSYIISLVVNDGELNSDPSNIEIFAIDADHIDDFIIALKKAVFAINYDLADSDFYNPNTRNALTSKILVVIKSYLEDGYSDSMLDKLTGDISSKMDGCDSDVEPVGPDANDWINNCDAQGKVYPFIKEAITIFESMS